MIKYATACMRPFDTQHLIFTTVSGSLNNEYKKMRCNDTPT